MNLFDNILNQSKNKFLGTQPSVPSTPSFATPQAPRTVNYTAPQVQQKPSMTLFSDEQQMFQRMKADNLSDDQSYGMLKKRRTDLLGGDGISADETKMLLRMQSDNVPVKQAVAMIQKRRQDMAEKANSIHDLHADEGVVEQTLKAPFRAIGDVASQTWQGIGKGTEGLIDASFRGVNDLNKMIGSSDYSPELEKQLPQGGYLGDVAKIGAGTTGAVFNLGKAPLALGINTANQLPGAQYITQGIGKGIQYGAENLGAMAGVDKETSMDIATTGMNLLGMKPGMNTLQYGRGIVNAPGVMGKAGAIVKPVGESVVQTVKMPYDIAKGTIKGGVNIAKKVGPSIATASDAIQTGLNRMTKGEINKFQAEQGVSPGKYLNDRNIVSSGKPIEETLLEQMKASRDQATAGTEAIVGNFKMPTQKFGESEISYMREMLKDNYRHAKKTLDAEGTNQAKQLLDKYDTQGLTMGEINTAKRKMADNNPVNWNTDHASPRVQTVKRISDAVRNWQFDQAVKSGFTNLKEINKQTQAFYKLHEGITKWNDGIEANNKISLTDYLAFDADPSVFVAKKVLSSPYVRQGIVKGLNKISGRVVKPIEKATIDTINTKRAEYDYGNRNSNTGDRVVTGKQLALPAPSGKATGAKNVRVNQPKEAPIPKSDITSKSIIRRPTTATKLKTKEEVQLAKETARAKEIAQVEKDLNSALKSNYIPNKPDGARVFIERAMNDGKITREDAISMVEKLYENADGFKKPGYGKLLDDLYSNKKAVSFDDLLNEKTVQTTAKTAREMYLQTPKGMYETFRRQVGDRRYNHSTNDAIIADFKKKTGWDLMKDGDPTFDVDGNVVKSIKKPLIKPKNESKVNKPISSDTIPEGYIENAFGEIQKNPSNKKVSPKAPIDKPMIQLLDEKTPGYIKNSLELAQSPTTMGRYISEILGKDIKNVSVKDISEFYKKYGPFPKWEKRLQDGVTGYEKGRMPGMSENGYKQDKLLLKAFYQSKSLTPQSNAKQQGIKPKSTTTNVFGETIDKPSNKKGGFIKVPSLEINPEKAIKKYTNNSDKINKMLREGKTDSTITAVDEFIGKQPSYKGDVYRGLTVDEGKYDSILENIRKNGIKDKAYTSTTENYGDATTFARNGNGKKGIMFEIQSTNGKKIDKKYNAYNEEEILFPRNTQFKYVGEYKDAGRGLIIKLKEVQ